MSVQVLIILIYFALTITIGFVALKKSNSSDAFHGAGLGVMMCVAAGTGEWLGGTSTTGCQNMVMLLEYPEPGIQLQTL